MENLLLGPYSKGEIMDIIKINNDKEFPNGLNREQYVSFMHKALGQFGDPEKEIDLSIDYAFSNEAGKGGYIIAGIENGKLVGGVIMNETGMAGYIPENILVYVAVDSSMRGRGLGTQLIDKAHEWSDGNIALHVEYENPAKRLYERIGYESKYAEMRFNK